MSGTNGVEENELTPAAAFAAIGNETRLRILYELWDVARGPVNFTELRKRVGMRDSSQFNYHLRRLADTFITKTDEGYVLQMAGVEVIWAVMMGTYVETARLDPFEIPGTCAVCEGSLQARYDDGVLLVECSACGQLHEITLLPAIMLVGRTNEEAVAALAHEMRASSYLLVNGNCWGCGGTVTPTVMRDRTNRPKRQHDDLGYQPFDLGVNFECEHCTRWHTMAIGTPLLFHPAVIGFYSDHGVDLTDTPYWELDWCVSDNRTTLLSEEPWLARVTIPLGGEELRATIDDELTVTEIERVDTVAPETDETA